ncbi:MAG: NAD(+)/NADH kinase [Candidatus Brockarchaeota archaeon]|nr:NAD(+)/NADH kinase [Candidatus Brockarchaeota archaeon]
MYERIGVVYREDMKEAEKAACQVAECAKGRRVDSIAVAEDELETQIGKLSCDLLVCIGGDGTLLRGALLASDPNTPILHVNLGAKGYLAEIAPDQIPEALERVFANDYRMESAIKISSWLDGAALPEATNEVAVSLTAHLRMAYLDVDVDNFGMVRVLGDGAIVSSPLGSTAFSLNAGGPIVSTDLDAVILTPICASRPIRSIVLPSSATLKIKQARQGVETAVTVDGIFVRRLPFHSELRVAASKNRTNLIRFTGKYMEQRTSRLARGE